MSNLNFRNSEKKSNFGSDLNVEQINSENRYDKDRGRDICPRV